jgi:hypothetical protein
VAKHDELLEQGPQEAPEPETAEERSKRTGWGAAGGGILGGGVAAVKFGGLTKILFWLVAFRAIDNGWRIGAWAGVAIVLAAVVAFALIHSRRAT